MTEIVTVAFNPAVDVSTAVEQVIDTRKFRCGLMRKDPGGGINVARVVHRLGGDCLAVYLADGALGQELRRLVAIEEASGLCFEIADETRENFSIFETSTGRLSRRTLQACNA